LGSASQSTAHALLGAFVQNGQEFTATATTSAGVGAATLQANRVQFRAVIAAEAARADANVFDTGFIVSPDAYTTAAVEPAAQVTLAGGASVRGDDSVDIQARHDSVPGRSDALSNDTGGSINNHAVAENDLHPASLVTGQQGALVTTRQL